MQKSRPGTAGHVWRLFRSVCLRQSCDRGAESARLFRRRNPSSAWTKSPGTKTSVGSKGRTSTQLNPIFVCLTYCEGDVIVTVDDTDEFYSLRVRSAVKFYRKYRSTRKSLLPVGEAGVFLLRNLHRVPASVTDNCYLLVVDRKLEEYVLPDGWAIVAAGRRASDQEGTARMHLPLANHTT